MVKILLASDNHGNINVLKNMVKDNPKCNYYYLCGDSQLRPEEIIPFISVKGNCDLNNYYRGNIIVDIEDRRILITHGHEYNPYYSYDKLVYTALQNNCDTIFFGHLHIYVNKEIGGVRVLNPGSCTNSRDLSEPSYMLVTINGKDIKVERKLAHV